ncbi:asparaginase [Lipingzhangella sp. LS1_29]|uniref:Asparaginase n=1 Tax=Lipingzhangella rawalii TaxID=2055835 RepID=A0ABU2H9F6_9ACTN|nr:asparaginase [Lipingzhangella rawalii]MDS1271949.1 asparaginase [Lipingzhangella rawalii]
MPSSACPPYVPLVEAVRSGFQESVHYGAVVGLSASGELAYARGPVGSPMLPRSSAKPLQALTVLRAGAQLTGAEIAIAAGSHSGQDLHVHRVRATLAAAGLSPADLRCPADWPLDASTRDALVCSGEPRSRERMNCSGKHAAMLAACVSQGWPTESYLSPDHPLQRMVRTTLEELCGEPVSHTTVDGCGAPQLAVSLAGLARGIHALTAGTGDSHRHAVVTAMRDYPQYVAGPGRHDTVLMQAVPGLISKQGADGVMVVAAATGETVAVKISDGDQGLRARTVAALAALAEITDLDLSAGPVEELRTGTVLGGGQPVGVVRPVSG